MQALILLDLQNDYGTFGALPINDAEAIIPIANALSEHFQLVVATKDWHPADHKCFAANHPWRHPGQTIDVNGLQQELSIIHCVQNSFGAELMGGLAVNKINEIFQKGTDINLGSDSGFYDLARKRTTGMYEYLKDANVKEVFILGLGIETIKSTTLEALNLGFQTYLIEDAILGNDQGQLKIIKSELRLKGVKIIKSSFFSNKI